MIGSKKLHEELDNLKADLADATTRADLAQAALEAEQEAHNTTRTELDELKAELTRRQFFCALVAIHVWVKDLPHWIIALPGALWGVEIANLAGR